MAGLLAQGADRGHCRETYLANLRPRRRRNGKHDITLLIEPINTRGDIPNYFLNTQAGRMPWWLRLARPIYGCKWTFIIVRSSKAIWP
jgi:hydroxypyruvate isomerase